MGAGRLQLGWEGEGGDERDYISHFSFHVLFDSLRYQCFSRNIPGPPDYRRDLDQSHNNNKGEDVLHFPQGDRMKDV